MVEFGEELIIDSFRIPWLIWIQLIVLMLLLLLLYSFSLLTSSDLPSAHDDASLSSPSPSPSSSSLHGSHSQKLQPQVGEINGATSRSSLRSRRPNGGGEFQEDRSRSVDNNNENKEGGSSVSMKDRTISTQSMYSNNVHHPCNIVRLAKVAFLKCLGLDSNSATSIPDRKSSSREHANER